MTRIRFKNAPMTTFAQVVFATLVLTALSAPTFAQEAQAQEAQESESLVSSMSGSAMFGSALSGSALSGSALSGSALSGSALFGSALFGSATPMQTKAAQRYSVRFTEVANSCEPRKISLAKSTIEIISTGKRSIRVTIPTIPELKGRHGKRGKFSARVKRGKTIIQGIDGKFSVAGTQTDNGKIELVFIAEYYKGKTPLCTTSWNASGTQQQ